MRSVCAWPDVSRLDLHSVSYRGDFNSELGGGNALKTKVRSSFSSRMYRRARSPKQNTVKHHVYRRLEHMDRPSDWTILCRSHSRGNKSGFEDAGVFEVISPEAVGEGVNGRDDE